MALQWSRVSPSIRSLVAEVPQSAPVRAVAHAFNSQRLRILAFHGVADLGRFSLLVDHILQWYQPVASQDVADALAGSRSLPRNPVWFTFDDGLPSTFASGGMLASRGVHATAFVCPSVLDTQNPLWFQARERCHRRGLFTDQEESSRFALKRLKVLPDAERRKETDEMRRRLSNVGDGNFVQADQAALEAWVGQGHDVGNHTWDHPLLDRCSESEQRDQVLQADRSLKERGLDVTWLAYPNGNWAKGSARAVSDLGYAGSLMFDHRLTTLDGDPHRLSRLRIDSDASRRRAASILAGAHSTAFHLVSGG